MKQKFADSLRAFRRDVYKIEHDPEEVKHITEESLHFTEDFLDNAYHYHFHKLPDASRAEIIKMVNNYALEALLPPIVEKMTRRQLILEKKLDLLVGMLEKALDRIGDDDA